MNPSPATRPWPSSWFAATAATALLPLAARFLPGAPATTLVLTALALLVFLGVLVLWAAQALGNPRSVGSEFSHPVQGGHLFLLPMTLVLLGLDLLAFLPLGALILVLVGSLMTLGLGLGYRSPDPLGWMVPSAAHLAVFLGMGEVMLSDLFPAYTDFLNLLGFFGLGAGVFLFLLNGAPNFHRALTSVWYWISVPVAIVSLATLKIQGAIPWSLWVPFLFWGFAFWTFLLATFQALNAWRIRQFPFDLSRWAAVLALATLALATGALGHAAESPWLTGLYFVLMTLLALVWVWTAVRTLWALGSGKLFGQE